MRLCALLLLPLLATAPHSPAQSRIQPPHPQLLNGNGVLQELIQHAIDGVTHSGDLHKQHECKVISNQRLECHIRVLMPIPAVCLKVQRRRVSRELRQECRCTMALCLFTARPFSSTLFCDAKLLPVPHNPASLSSLCISSAGSMQLGHSSSLKIFSPLSLPLTSPGGKRS